MQGTIIFLSVDIILAVCLALRIASYVMYSIILNNMFIVSFIILCPSAIVTIIYGDTGMLSGTDLSL